MVTRTGDSSSLCFAVRKWTTRGHSSSSYGKRETLLIRFVVFIDSFSFFVVDYWFLLIPLDFSWLVFVHVDSPWLGLIPLTWFVLIPLDSFGLVLTYLDFFLFILIYLDFIIIIFIYLYIIIIFLFAIFYLSWLILTHFGSSCLVLIFILFPLTHSNSSRFSLILLAFLSIPLDSSCSGFMSRRQREIFIGCWRWLLVCVCVGRVWCWWVVLLVVVVMAVVLRLL